MFIMLPSTSKHFLHRSLLLFIGFFVVSTMGAAQASTDRLTSTAYPSDITALCTHVVDGDSLYLKGFKPQVRLWGVDAPERKQQGYGAAKSALEQLAQKQILHCKMKDVDKYGRWVARCFLAQTPTTDAGDIAANEINRALIDEGVAQEYCWFSKGFYGHCQ